MRKGNSGFTLIELMIVISILSILATMALPSFQDRIIRTQVKEALNLSEIAKKGIEEYYNAKGDFPENNASAGKSLLCALQSLRQRPKYLLPGFMGMPLCLMV
jgi:type IV pilus assembly protein PilA